MKLDRQALFETVRDSGTLLALSGLGAQMFKVQGIEISASIALIVIGVVLIVGGSIRRTDD